MNQSAVDAKLVLDHVVRALGRPANMLSKIQKLRRFFRLADLGVVPADGLA